MSIETILMEVVEKTDEAPQLRKQDSHEAEFELCVHHVVIF